ncbi:hypothetical protein RCC89_20835 [Cytophagaceae bacterium ABcell3]|nr:hypothetical protein RCC89_20835 [Cytophagaceae bacterium ABcell3]
MEKDSSFKKLIKYILVGFAVAVVVFFIKFLPSDSDGPEEKLYALVPSSAILVYENILFEAEDSLVTPALENVHQVMLLDGLKKKVIGLDSLIADQDLSSLWGSEKVSAAMFPNGRYQCSYLLYVPAKSKRKGLPGMIKNSGLKIKKRKYKGVYLSEVIDPDGEPAVAYVTIGDYIVLGDAPSLLEDVIRVYKGEASSFSKIRKKAERHAIHASSGAVLVNYDALPSYFSSFANNKGAETFQGLKDLAAFAVLDMTFREDEVLMNGFTDVAGNEFLNVFNEQRPVSPDFVNYVSNQSAVVYFWGFSDGGRFMNALYDHWSVKNQADQTARWDSVSLNYNLEGLYHGLANLAGIAYLEPSNPSKSERVVYLKAKEADTYLKKLRKLAGDTVSNPETFKGHKIFLLERAEIPSLLFGNPMKGFGSCYATICGDFVVLAENAKNLKKLISDIDDENVWGKTIRFNKLVEETLSGFNMFFSMNISASKNFMKHYAAEHVKAKLENDPSFKKNDLLSVQLSRAGDSYITSLALHLNSGESEELPPTLVSAEKELKIEEGLLAGPFTFSNGIAWQDSTGKLYFRKNKNTYRIDSLPEVKMMVSADLDGNSIDDFIFIAGTEVFACDQKLNLKEGFPVKAPEDIRLHTLSLLDYNNSGNYRISVSDISGNVMLIDRKGKILAPWDPAEFDYRLACPVKHIRIKGKDMIVVLTENGKLHVTNRRSEPYPGFPVDLKAIVKSPFYINEGTSFNSTIINILSDKGEFFSIDMTGKVKKRKQLVRLSPESTFKLRPDFNGKGYKIFRQTRTQLDFLDQQGDLMVDLQGFSGYGLQVEYINAGSSREAVIVMDKGNNRLYVFSLSGKNLTHDLAINSRRLQSGSPILGRGIIFYKEYDGVIEQVMVSDIP